MIEHVEPPDLSPRVYRFVDYTTKVAGLGLVVAGLEAGGGTTLGLVLGATGVTIGISTVFIDTNE